MVLLGLGMTISVAPLTTVVMSSVDQRRTGSASGVNNAVSQVAALLALALSAPLFFHVFSGSLSDALTKNSVGPVTLKAVQLQASRLAAIQTEDPLARLSINQAFVSGFRLIALFASGSAAAAGGIAALTIAGSRPKGTRA
jgi:hypothetical protein